MGIGDWGLGIGGLGIGPNPQSPIPNPQSPIPIKKKLNYFLNNEHLIVNIFLNYIFFQNIYKIIMKFLIIVYL